jgi:uncharacterized membrane protein YqiK
MSGLHTPLPVIVVLIIVVKIILAFIVIFFNVYAMLGPHRRDIFCVKEHIGANGVRS